MNRFVLLLIVGLSLTVQLQAQTIVQTYVDRCTGEVFRFNISYQGATVVMFYNRSRAFTAADVATGVFRTWLDETYLWWRNLNPCSVNQATATATTQTTQQIATTAINIPIPPPPPTPPPTPSTSGSTSSNSTNSSSSSSSETKSESTTQESSKSESSGESESTSESSEETSESSEESSESEEKEEKKEDKKKSSNPPIVSANVAAMQSLTGRYDLAASFGISKSSLLGNESYGVNTMVWSNLRQFMLTGSYTKIESLPNGEANILHSTSLTALKMFSSYTMVLNHGKVFLGRDGSLFGMSLTLSSTSMIGLENAREIMSSFSSLFFYTKTKTIDRLSISPMVALGTQLLSYDHVKKMSNFPHASLCIFGLNINYQLTQRFTANVGANTATNLGFTLPAAMNFTIGSRMLF
jgi:chloramphenicol O-acetyltransferase